MGYAAIVLDPNSKAERIQEQAARFLSSDYKTREGGCATDMLPN